MRTPAKIAQEPSRAGALSEVGSGIHADPIEDARMRKEATIIAPRRPNSVLSGAARGQPLRFVSTWSQYDYIEKGVSQLTRLRH